MKFCSECNNILEPLAEDDKLLGKCKVCGNKEEYGEKKIMQTNYSKNENKSDQLNIKNFIYDNSLPRTKQIECPNKECPSIKNKSLQEAVSFIDERTLKVNYICAVCFTFWPY